jgi:glycosyltransferase involved in cell wall biosynthesis
MLSVVIITKNESSHIAHCLHSVSWADEIIVVDSGSTDDTVCICKQYTDLVFETDDWPGFGIQKQRALDKAQGEWVLSIDADECVTPELQQEIQQAMQQTQYTGYEIPRLSSYCGRNIRHGGWWPDYVLRLFRRQNGKFTTDLVHESITVQGNIRQLKNPLLHESYINVEEVLDKVNSYSTLGAKKLYNTGKKATLSKALINSMWMFFRTYVLKAAFLDGRQGLMMSISNAEATYYKYIKLIELHHRR